LGRGTRIVFRKAGPPGEQWCCHFRRQSVHIPFWGKSSVRFELDALASNARDLTCQAKYFDRATMVAGNERSTHVKAKTKTAPARSSLMHRCCLHLTLSDLPSHCSWLNDLWRYDIETALFECIQESSDSSADGGGSVMETDSQVKGSAPSRRFGYVSVVHDGKLVIFGGTCWILWVGLTNVNANRTPQSIRFQWHGLVE
jgi:hypothetical protein